MTLVLVARTRAGGLRLRLPLWLGCCCLHVSPFLPWNRLRPLRWTRIASPIGSGGQMVEPIFRLAGHFRKRFVDPMQRLLASQEGNALEDAGRYRRPGDRDTQWLVDLTRLDLQALLHLIERPLNTRL